MLKLNDTDDELQVVTTGSSTDTDYYATYTDFPTTGGGNPTFGVSAGNIASATTTTIVPSPGSGVTRQINIISITNNDTPSSIAQVIFDDGTNTRKVSAVYTIATGYSLEYNSNTNWELTPASSGALTYPLLANDTPSATAPSYSFASDSNTGMYNPSADTLGFTTGGTLRHSISTTAVTSTLPYYSEDGTNTAPTYTFTGGTNYGMYQPGSELAFTVNGTRRFAGTSAGLEVVGNVILGTATISTTGVLTIGGTGETLATFEDDAGVVLFHNNSAMLSTTAAGITVPGISVTSFGIDVNGNGITSIGAVTGATTISTASTLTINGTGETLATFADDGAVTLYNNNVTELATQDNTATGKTTGAQVKHRNTTFYDVGMNQLPVGPGEDANDTLEGGHCGAVYFKDGSSAITLTLESNASTDFPVGGVTTVINANGTGDIDVTEGASTTLYWLTGTSVVDTGGTATVGPGGLATLWREDAAIYYIWGTGISV